MKALHILMAAVLVLGVLGGAAHAGIETTFVHVNTVELDGTAYNVYDMMVTVDTDWTNSRLSITLTSGHFYNESLAGTDTERDPRDYQFVPELEWDTYAATPSGFLVTATFTPGSQFGQNPNTSDPAMGNTVIAAGWFDAVNTGSGTHKIARLTISPDASGEIAGTTFDANPGSPDPRFASFDGMYTITGGHIVPEPATLSLLALGGLAVMRRKRQIVAGSGRPRSLAPAQGRTAKFPSRQRTVHCHNAGEFPPPVSHLGDRSAEMNKWICVSAICVSLAVATSYGQTGSIVTWGDNGYGQWNAPAGKDFAAVSGGGWHSVALRADGTIEAWGRNDYGQSEAPTAGGFQTVAAGYCHNLALRADGSIEAWGRNDDGQCNAPAGTGYLAVVGGGRHSIAIRADGSLEAWGYNGAGQCNVPAGNDFVAVSAGYLHSLALREDGSIEAWGESHYGQNGAPGDADFIAVCDGDVHSVALRNDGSLESWGFGAYPAYMPDGDGFVDIGAGDLWSVALHADGHIEAWGGNIYGQLDVPAGNEYFAVSSGFYHGLALTPEPASLSLLALGALAVMRRRRR